MAADVSGKTYEEKFINDVKPEQITEKQEKTIRSKKTKEKVILENFVIKAREEE